MKKIILVMTCFLIYYYGFYGNYHHLPHSSVFLIISKILIWSAFVVNILVALSVPLLDFNKIENKEKFQKSLKPSLFYRVYNHINTIALFVFLNYYNYTIYSYIFASSCIIGAITLLAIRWKIEE